MFCTVYRALSRVSPGNEGRLDSVLVVEEVGVDPRTRTYDECKKRVLVFIGTFSLFITKPPMFVQNHSSA